MTLKHKHGHSGKSFVELSFEKFATTARADLRFAPLNALLLIGLSVVGLMVHLTLHTFSVEAVFLSLGSALVLEQLMWLTQVWEAVVILGAAVCLAIYL
ncbi:MAG: hypothetical protein WBI27_19605, partial [Thermoanaerobaculia bacterium]